MFRWALRKGIDKVTHLLAVAALVGGVGLAAPAAAEVSDQPPAVSAYTITPERIAASVAAVVGLIGMALGGLALARSRRTVSPPLGIHARRLPTRYLDPFRSVCIVANQAGAPSA